MKITGKWRDAAKKLPKPWPRYFDGTYSKRVLVRFVWLPDKTTGLMFKPQINYSFAKYSFLSKSWLIESVSGNYTVTHWSYIADAVFDKIPNTYTNKFLHQY